MHKVQDFARNSNNTLYFEGDTIYSYGSHFPIATHVTNAANEPAILFTTDTYSVTTARHISYVRRAIPNHATVFNVELCTIRKSDGKQPYRDMFKAYKDQIPDAAERVTRARSRRWQYEDELKDLIEEANRFNAFFRLGYKPIECPNTKDGLRHLIGEVTKARIAESQARERAARKVREQIEEERKRQRAEDEPKLRQWLSGTGVYFPESWRHSGTDYLRVQPTENTTVETSKGAYVPLDHVKKALPVVLRILKEGKHWRSNGHTIHLGPYSLDEITTDGKVLVGCHCFTQAEVERFAATLED